jgi:hypothetical protein
MAVHNDAARFKVLACGRRWGKTRLGVNECIQVAARGGRAWWVAPTYRMTEVGWRPLRQIATKLGWQVRLGDRQVLAPNGGEVSIRSSDNYDTLRGEGLDFVVLDECAFIAEQAWTEALRPALSDRLGRAMFISTPKGRNWFWRYWQLGQDTTQSEWRSWQFPTASNPFIKASEIEAARGMLPERTFEQEYLALFLEDGGGVFRRVLAAATLAPQDAPTPGHQYVMGVDWGKSNDWTVITVWDTTAPSLVYMDRFNQIDYAFQHQRLLALYERWRPDVIRPEVNSIGGPVVEQLQREGLPVVPFETTNATKFAAVEALALAFERGDIQIINDPQLIAELQAFELSRTATGMVRYAAPEGMHDDCVMSAVMGYSAFADAGPLLLWGSA